MNLRLFLLKGKGRVFVQEIAYTNITPKRVAVKTQSIGRVGKWNWSVIVAAMYSKRNLPMLVRITFAVCSATEIISQFTNVAKTTMRLKAVGQQSMAPTGKSNAGKP